MPRPGAAPLHLSGRSPRRSAALRRLARPPGCSRTSPSPRRASLAHLASESSPAAGTDRSPVPPAAAPALVAGVGRIARPASRSWCRRTASGRRTRPRRRPQPGMVRTPAPAGTGAAAGGSPWSWKAVPPPPTGHDPHLGASAVRYERLAATYHALVLVAVECLFLKLQDLLLATFEAMFNSSKSLDRLLPGQTLSACIQPIPFPAYGRRIRRVRAQSAPVG